jgi:hypothetical protein
MMESTLFLQKVVKLSGLVFFQNVKVWIRVLTLISRNSKYVDGSYWVCGLFFLYLGAFLNCWC